MTWAAGIIAGYLIGGVITGELFLIGVKHAPNEHKPFVLANTYLWVVALWPYFLYKAITTLNRGERNDDR